MARIDRGGEDIVIKLAKISQPNSIANRRATTGNSREVIKLDEIVGEARRGESCLVRELTQRKRLARQ